MIVGYQDDIWNDNPDDFSIWYLDEKTMCRLSSYLYVKSMNDVDYSKFTINLYEIISRW